jgi:hypothetical protein
MTPTNNTINIYINNPTCTIIQAGQLPHLHQLPTFLSQIKP